jgi:transposase-like protein
MKEYVSMILISGGPNQIVQIDETKLGHKRKYNRGRVPGIDKWLFGGIDSVTHRIFLRLVDNRTRATLLPIIQHFVLPGTTIYSDTWAPYFTLSDHGYEHHMVNHSVEFVTANGVHTQQIESLWHEIKQGIKSRRGLREDQIPGYLDEFMYRREFPNDTFFETFLGHVARYYPGNV